MPGAGSANWKAQTGNTDRLLDGGELYALAVKGECSKVLTGGFDDGETFEVEWVLATNPEAPNTENRAAVFESAPCAAVFERGEGAWFENGLVYFVSTSGGAVNEGQVWVYDPKKESLTMQYESRSALDVDGPDNIAVSKKGGIVLVRLLFSANRSFISSTRDISFQSLLANNNSAKTEEATLSV